MKGSKGEHRGRRPTMTDVAKVAGVSQSSVSLVLNEMTGSRISAETQIRVREAAHLIGYQLPSVRRDLNATARKNVIAFVIDEISTSPHPVVSFDGARDFAFEHGFLTSIHTTRSNPDLEAAILQSLAEDPCIAGIIYATIFTRKVSVPDLLKRFPTILLNCYNAEAPYLCVLPNETAGGFAATQHLIDLGHQRIGFINGEPWMDAAVDRLKGYSQALKQAGLPFDPALVRSGDWLPLRGYEASLELLSLNCPPTAIFCGNDLMAIGAMEAAAEKGFNVPDDLSIMGYDDQELARYTHPPLSTLVLPNYEMGQTAARMLIEMTAQQKIPSLKMIKVEGPVVARGSTASFEKQKVLNGKSNHYHGFGNTVT